MPIAELFFDDEGPHILAVRGRAVGRSDDSPAERERTPPRLASINPRAPRRRPSTPTGDQLRAFLQDGIARIDLLDAQPLAAPVALPFDDVVPIARLLYSGRGAIARAIELREELRQNGGPPDPLVLNELYELLDLAGGSE
ncbi:MAG: hypothetical protein WKG32_03310 [Gemmatimonadaceae bacterium]